jgi:hypothetical protein
MGPELLDDLVAYEPMSVGQREQRDEILRAACGPLRLGDLPAVLQEDAEAPEHVDPDVV